MNEIEMRENKSTPESLKITVRKTPRFNLSRTNWNIKHLAIAVLLILILILGSGIIGAGSSALLESYKTTYEKEKDGHIILSIKNTISRQKKSIMFPIVSTFLLMI